MTYDTYTDINLANTRQTADGGYITIGMLGGGDAILIVKLDGAGNTQWSRQYSGVSNFGGNDILQGTDGNYYFIATGNTLGVIAGKLDNTGTLVWMKTYAVRYEDASGIAQDNNYLILAGDTYNGKGQGILLKVQKSDGSLVWGKEYASTDEFFEKVMVASDGYYVHGQRANTTTSDFSDQIILKTDFNGNLLWSKYQQPFGASADFAQNDLLVKANGNLACLFSSYNTNLLYLQEISPAGAVLSNKLYSNNPGYAYAFTQKTNQSLLLAGNITEPVYPTTRAYVLQLDPAGNSGNCPPTTPAASIINYTPVVTTLAPVVGNLTPTIGTTCTTVPIPITRVECQLPDCTPFPTAPPDTCGVGCTTSGITGAIAICDKTINYTYLLNRNSGCPAVPVWSIDPAFATVVKTTDSSIVLQFTGNGSAMLHSTLTTRCKVWQDSILISTHSPSGTLNLGPNISLCTSSIYTLHAGNSFASYHWQDGSADSTFTLSAPGTYFVQAPEYCGAVYQSTVVVTQAPVVPFNMVTDMVACKQDTVAVTAPGGFTKYYWSPNYNINSRYAASIQIVASNDTTYTVVAEKAPGCLVVDTVHVKVNLSTPVVLGNDTSICKLDTVTINAGAGFNSYLWNTGALSQSIRVGAAGEYSVTVTNTNNCKSRDTLQILNVYNLPLVSLGTDTPICTNTSIVFDAGAGETSYAWQDGSTGSTFTASAPGTYWVRVTDANGCHNTDTVVITGFNPSPAGFLPPDTAICSFQPLDLKATGSFAQYSWSNGSTGDAIVITTAGNYWLQVTNASGCSATDTVHVTTKDCLLNVFLPNAFTPAGASNTLFHALVHGDLVNFRLTIFNRWGQQIFTTQDPSKGWDGTFNGALQSTGVFAWVCTYKLIGPGQVQTTKRGTVTLIR